jgi:hypothetical protein
MYTKLYSEILVGRDLGKDRRIFKMNLKETGSVNLIQERAVLIKRFNTDLQKNSVKKVKFS